MSQQPSPGRLPAAAAAPSPPDPATGEHPYLALQRAALRAVLDLSAEVIEPLEAEIEQRYRRALEVAEEQRRSATEKVAARLEEKLAALEQSAQQRIEQAETQYAEAEAELAASVRTALGQISADFREIHRNAQRELEDNLLMAETVAQATLSGIRKEFQAVRHQVAAMRDRLDAIERDMQAALAAFRYRPVEQPVEPWTPPDGDLKALCQRLLEDARRQLDALRNLPAPRLFVGNKPWLLAAFWTAGLTGATAGLSVAAVPNWPPLAISAPVGALLGAAGAGATLRYKWRQAQQQLRNAHARLLTTLAQAREALAERLERAEQKRQHDERVALQKREADISAAREAFETRMARTRQRRQESEANIDRMRAEAHDEHVQRRDKALAGIRRHRETSEQQLRQTEQAELARIAAEYDKRVALARQRHQEQQAELRERMRRSLDDLRRFVEQTRRLDLPLDVTWDATAVANWRPPEQFPPHVPLGFWRVELERLAASARSAAPFLAECGPVLRVPALLTPPVRCSLLLQSGREGRKAAIETLRAVMLRLLTSLPPGRVHFTIIDPVGLGENFAGFMHLADYEEALVGGRIWTESEHIEARLAELTAHMENVIQKYLRNEFATIDQYNAQAGQLAEPYRFLVIADFPANFGDQAARRLASIVASGPRCGVFTLIAQDQRLPLPPDLDIADLAAAALHLRYEDGRFVCQDELLSRFELQLDRSPDEQTLTQLMHRVGRAAHRSLRVEVPFESVAPPDGQLWSRSSAAGLEVPLGHTGAVRLQHLRLGRGMAQHMLIAGKTGSGKSTLLHVLITNVALWYSPQEVELYLVDFKKGVEFKCYVTGRLPHAKAIAVESDREFGLSVLQRLDAEMTRRGELFRAAGVQDLPAYRETTGRTLPRVLLIVDEFQVFFSEDDRLAQEATLLLDRLVRQGRAFGIHVILGSQTLGGTASLPRSTMGQMAVRVALQCSEADSQLILDDTNLAARLLSRPGEAIYNDAGGLVEGNSPFQTAWLPDEQRNAWLARIAQQARELPEPPAPPAVFEGNAPADIRANRPLSALLAGQATPGEPRAWLGEPVAIKPPTAAVLRRQSGANLLIVGQYQEYAEALLAAALLSLAAHHAPPEARFVVLDGQPADAEPQGPLHGVASRLAHDVRFVAWREVAEALSQLAAETRRRIERPAADQPAVYLLINGLQRYRMLRRSDDEFSFDAAEREPGPDRALAELLRDGPPAGLHVLAWADTLAALERTLDRRSLAEFDHRVLFQMSATDSANLIDSPAANRLGLYRALLYSEEQGLIEKFRPYGPPSRDWLDAVLGSTSPR